MTPNMQRLAAAVLAIAIMAAFGKFWHWVVSDLMTDRGVSIFLVAISIFCAWAIYQDAEIRRRVKARYSRLRRLLSSKRE